LQSHCGVGPLRHPREAEVSPWLEGGWRAGGEATCARDGLCASTKSAL
jgi:hypothetical protein